MIITTHVDESGEDITLDHADGVYVVSAHSYAYGDAEAGFSDFQTALDAYLQSVSQSAQGGSALEVIERYSDYHYFGQRTPSLSVCVSAR